MLFSRQTMGALAMAASMIPAGRVEAKALEAKPTPQELRTRIRAARPRLFVNRDTLPALAARKKEDPNYAQWLGNVKKRSGSDCSIESAKTCFEQWKAKEPLVKAKTFSRYRAQEDAGRAVPRGRLPRGRLRDQ